MSRQFKFLIILFLFVGFISFGTLLFFSRTILTVDGKQFDHYSLSKGTVRDLLSIYQVQVSSNDIVIPALDKELKYGSRVQVVRVQEIISKQTETVDFLLEWKRRLVNNLRKVEIQHGVRKTTIWQIKRVLHDGKEVSNHKTVKKFTQVPVTRIVFLGHRNYPHKIYDLSKVKKIKMIATAYWVGDPQVPGTVTYSGHKVERGLVAVDPHVIPLGSRLYIPGYGYGYASDTGSAIKGNRIDLFVESKQASRKWEYKKVDVYILERAKKW